MDHRSDYRTGTSDADPGGLVVGEAVGVEGFDPILRLKEISRKGLNEAPCDGEPRVLHISFYCYKSFPIRIFHALALKDGIDSHAIFFKNNFTNDHLPITDTEVGLLVDLVQRIDPHVITMSIMAPYVVAARQACGAIREISDATIITGGKFPTISTVDALDFADYTCKGEGELALLQVFERLRRGQDFNGITGLWHKDGDGNVVDMGQERLYQDMDDIPYPAIGEPNMHFIELDSATEHDPEVDDEEMLMMAGRGCVYLCSFCVNSVLIPMNRGNGTFVRIRSPEHVIEEVNYRLEKCRNAKFISFNDEVFGVFDDWVEDFSAKYKKHVSLPFECELVPKLIKEENVKLLADAGMFSLHFGIQSGHDDIRKDIMHRPGTNDEFLEKAAILRKYQVKPQFDMILENPFDTEEALIRALELLLALPQPLNLNTYKMQFFPHYPFTKMAIEAGHITEKDVSYEALAESVLYNFVYRPKFPGFRRREYLENCIYLIPWNSPSARWLIARLLKRHNLLFGFAASVLARIRYGTAFEQKPVLIWGRRLVLGLGCLLSGDVKQLWRRMAGVYVNRKALRSNTGRISMR